MCRAPLSFERCSRSAGDVGLGVRQPPGGRQVGGKSDSWAITSHHAKRRWDHNEHRVLGQLLRVLGRRRKNSRRSRLAVDGFRWLLDWRWVGRGVRVLAKQWPSVTLGESARTKEKDFAHTRSVACNATTRTAPRSQDFSVLQLKLQEGCRK